MAHLRREQHSGGTLCSLLLLIVFTLLIHWVRKKMWIAPHVT